MYDEIAKFFGNAIAYGGGGAVVAYLLFRYLGASWIENKFATQLEKYKHNQEIELQRLRIEIDSTLSGTIKLQEFEFGIIPEAWRLLNNANFELEVLVNPFKRIVHLDSMNKEEIEEFFQETELRESEKNQIRNADKKWEKLSKIDFYHNYGRVTKALSELKKYITENGIFFPITMKKNFESIIENLNSACTDTLTGHEYNDFKIKEDALRKVSSEIRSFRKKIEDEIHERLHSHGMTKSETSK